MTRDSMEVDILCVGFGPAAAGFLTTLSKGMAESGTMLNVLAYERADDIGFGVSGVLTRARGIRESFPQLDPAAIPMAAIVQHEKVVYLLDPHGASRRSAALCTADAVVRGFGQHRDLGVELPYIPPFLHKQGGLILSLGQFIQWVGGEIASTGMVQVWPGMPVAEAVVEDGAVRGVRLCDQGVTKEGAPDVGYMPGMEIRARLTVVADGPVGAVGRQLDRQFGMPDGHHQREWAVGMKMVIDLPEGSELEAGTVYHTFGYPEPEIFGFLYVHPGNVATVGIFVPSWLNAPMRTSYRYLQHYVVHPYLWRHLKGGRLRSWGAKSLQESGRRGEPHLCGEGFARIGEGSGSTNVLTGSGVDEAWTTGVQLADAVLELTKAGEPLSRENLERAYVAHRRESWVEQEGRVAEKARDGFHRGVVTGLIGMALAGFTDGRASLEGEPQLMPSLTEYYGGKIPADELQDIVNDCRTRGVPCHDAIMDRCGWPPIPFDGQLLISHQDALLIGGKVQASPGFADHVRFVYPDFCEHCAAKLCVEMCSGQALSLGSTGVPVFDREKCVHCGACLWNCTSTMEDDPAQGAIEFKAGSGGLHSGEN